jgi:hypothetical protein
VVVVSAEPDFQSEAKHGNAKPGDPAMKRMMLAIILCASLALADGDGLFWSARLTGGQVEFYRSSVATPGAAYWRDTGTPIKYLKLTAAGVEYMTAGERADVDAAIAAAAAAAAEAAAIAASNAAVAQAQFYAQGMTNAWIQVTNSAHTFKTLGGKYIPGWPTNTAWTYDSAMSAFLAMPSTNRTTDMLWDNVFWQKSYVELTPFFSRYYPSTNPANPSAYEIRAPWLWTFPGVP